MVEPRIVNSARKHQIRDGFDDSDIIHVFEHPLRVVDQSDDDLRMLIGETRSGRMLLEIGYALSVTGDIIVIHAMLARKKYTR